MYLKKYTKADYVHCDFCDWKCLKIWRNKYGKLIHGQKRLYRHVGVHHVFEMDQFLHGDDFFRGKK